MSINAFDMRGKQNLQLSKKPTGIKTSHSQSKPRKIIHIRVRSTRSIRPIVEKANNNILRNECSSIDNSTQEDIDIKTPEDIEQISNSSLSNQNVTYNVDRHTKHKPMNNSYRKERGILEDHHRYLKENKKTRRRIIVAIIIFLIIIVIFLAIFIPLLIKFRSTPTVTTTLTPVLRWKKVGITIAGQTGLAGNSSNLLNAPKEAIWHRPNLLYIVDTTNHRIQRFDMNSSTMTTIAGNGSAGSSLNQLNSPLRILIDSNNGIYVADSFNYRIQYWSNGATNGISVAGTGTRGSFYNQFDVPFGLAYDSNPNIFYISDYNNDRVMRYLLGTSNGSLVAGGNSFGLSFIQLWKPAGLYFDSFSNSFFVADSNAQMIVQWKLNSANWTRIAGAAGFSGGNATLLNYPIDVTLDPMGNIYVADRNNHRIQLFMNGKTEGITIAGVTNTPGSNASLLWTPNSVRLDNQLNLYVTDTNNHRIQMFQRY